VYHFANYLSSQNMGQRLVEVELSYTGNADGSGILHCSNLPPNPAIFQPGPACKWLFPSSVSTPTLSLLVVLFVVVDNVPSLGTLVMVGSGEITQQNVLPPAPLPVPSISDRSTLPPPGNDRKQTNSARPTKAEVSWPSVLTWAFGTGSWMFLF